MIAGGSRKLLEMIVIFPTLIIVILSVSSTPKNYVVGNKVVDVNLLFD